MNESVEKIVDPRVDVLKEFCLRSLRVKSEKWDRLMISDEQRSYIMSFVDRQTPQVKLYFEYLNKK
jgi:hypothetical protein